MNTVETFCSPAYHSRWKIWGILLSNPIIALACETWHYGRYRRRHLVGVVTAFTLAQTIILCRPLALAGFLGRLQEGSLDFAGAVKFMGLYFLCDAIHWAFHFPTRIIDNKNGFLIRAQFRKEVFAALTELPMQWHRDRVSGESIDKLNKGANAIYAFSSLLFQPVYMIVRLLGSFVALLFFMPIASLAAFLACGVAISVIIATDKYYIPMRREINRAEHKVSAQIFDFLSNITTVITLRLAPKAQAQLDQSLYRALPTTVKNQILSEFKWCSTVACISILIVVVMLTKAYFDLAAGIALSVGSFYLLFEYLRQVGQSFCEFAWLWGAMVDQWTDVKSVDDILTESCRLRENTPVATIPQNWREIRLENLTFRYNDASNNDHHLKNLTFTLERGKRYALVGESGSGKSTLLRLLRGVLSPQSGTLTIDGSSYPLTALNNMTTLIPQDPEVFADTVEANVGFWMNTINDDMARPIELSRFDYVLERLPNGFATNISERGVNLSGGEKQRLALSRGIFFARESPIILMDEPTSSVDAVNERRIYEGIFSEFSEAIIVSSLHKLNLLDLFDEIFFFSNGTLVTKGTLPQLLLVCESFRTTYEKALRSSGGDDVAG